MSAGAEGSPSGHSCDSLRARRRAFAEAAAAMARESGIGALTEAGVAGAAGTDTDAFHDAFADVGECLRFGVLAGFEALTAPLGALEGGGRRERLEAAIGSYYAAIAAEPLLAELYLLHSYETRLGPEDPGLHESVLAFAPFLAAAGAESAQEPLPPRVEEFLGWAIVAAAERAARAGRAGELPDQAAEVAAFLATYFDPDHQQRGRRPRAA
jgi:hypothetical protein